MMPGCEACLHSMQNYFDVKPSLYGVMVSLKMPNILEKESDKIFLVRRNAILLAPLQSC